MNLYSRYLLPLLRLVFVLLIVLSIVGCSRPQIQYVEWNPTEPMKMNTWEKVDGHGYFFATPYESVAKAEFQNVTGYIPDTIPLRMYGFNIWFDGYAYHITQSR
jgi:hypothetical protein